VVRDDYVEVKFELREGLTPDVRAAIDSGLKTIFTYTVELKVDAGWWLDRTIATAVVTTASSTTTCGGSTRWNAGWTAATKIGNNRGSGSRPQWMTNVDYLPCSRRTSCNVTASTTCASAPTARPSYGSILWPFGSGTSAQTKFVFFR
jgi:hypothetical protein